MIDLDSLNVCGGGKCPEPSVSSYSREPCGENLVGFASRELVPIAATVWYGRDPPNHRGVLCQFSGYRPVLLVSHSLWYLRGVW